MSDSEQDEGALDTEDDNHTEDTISYRAAKRTWKQHRMREQAATNYNQTNESSTHS